MKNLTATILCCSRAGCGGVLRKTKGVAACCDSGLWKNKRVAAAADEALDE